jgi:hypothetical protein
MEIGVKSIYPSPLPFSLAAATAEVGSLTAIDRRFNTLSFWVSVVLRFWRWGRGLRDISSTVTSEVDRRWLV